MKQRGVLRHAHRVGVGALVAIGLAFAASPYAFGADGKRGGEPRKTTAAPQDAPGVGSLTPMLDGFKWGMTHSEVLNVYNRIGGLFDQEFNPLLEKAQPGVQQRALEADRDNRKAAFERSFLEFKDTPTGYDATDLKGEYTYRNRESIMMVDKGGKKRFFFFIGSPPGERLWKIYDDVPLREGGPLGASYQEALTKLQSTLGVPARVRAADAAQGLSFTTADWQDGSTHLRLVDRSVHHAVGVVVEEKSTLFNLPNLRANKAEDPLAIDPSIAAITRGGISDPDAKPPSGDAGAPPPKTKKK